MLTDSHCHLDFDEISNNLPLLLQECFNNNIHKIIVPSVSPKNWHKVLELTNFISTGQTPTNQSNKPRDYCQLFACLGIHPWYLNSLTHNDLDNLANIVKTNIARIVAIGETGIDGTIARDENNLEKQLTFFDFQLTLAKQHQLPIIIHHRRSHEHILPLLKQHKHMYGGVIHAFSGSYQQAKNYIDLGFKLGIGGTITYERAKKTINAVKRLPLEALILETDAPSMPLSGFQGEANSPLKLLNIVDCLCEIRSEGADLVKNTIEQNIQSLFFSRYPKALSAKTV